MQAYLLTVYIPSSLLVLIAWVSFWIDAKVAPARVALGITTVLTITTMTSGIMESLPVITYAKAIDYWLAVCLMFVISALMEFAYANHLVGEEARRLKKRKSSKLKQIRDVKEKKYETSVNMEMIAFEYFQESKHMTAETCDRISRIAYPLLFLLFNLIYWSYYLYSGNLNLYFSGLKKEANVNNSATDDTSTSVPNNNLIFDAF